MRDGFRRVILTGATRNEASTQDSSLHYVTLRMTIHPLIQQRQKN